jgi:hypothetical protein
VLVLTNKKKAGGGGGGGGSSVCSFSLESSREYCLLADFPIIWKTQ